MADNEKTITSSRSVALSSQKELGTVRPESLEQIGRFARAGRISPYRIKLSAISDKLAQSILSSNSVTPSHLESLDRVATLLLMKAQYVANGGSFPKIEHKSVFDERVHDKVDSNQQTLLLLTQLIERNFHEISASYPRPKPETIVTEELRVPTAKRLLKIVERMSKTIQKPEKTITLQKKRLISGQRCERFSIGSAQVFRFYSRCSSPQEPQRLTLSPNSSPFSNSPAERK